MLDRELKRVIAKVSVATLIVIAMFAALAVVLMQNYDVGTQTAYANGGEPTQSPTQTPTPTPTPTCTCEAYHNEYTPLSPKATPCVLWIERKSPPTEQWKSSIKDLFNYGDIDGVTSLGDIVDTLVWTYSPMIDESVPCETDVTVGMDDQPAWVVCSHGKSICLHDDPASDNYTVKVYVYGIQKIPLGSSASTCKYVIGKVYVPTRWGGTLTLSSSANIFYKDGSDLDLNTAKSIIKDEYNLYRVAQTTSYTVPTDQHGWYYIQIASTSLTSVSVTFEQSKETDRKPWSCEWYPVSEESENGPNLYDTNGCLDKYDAAYFSNNRKSKDREKRNFYIGGHFLKEDELLEANAEMTVGYDFNNDDADNDPWTGWTENVAWNFWDHTKSPPDSNLTYDTDNDGSLLDEGDQDVNDIVDVSWWGHCAEAAAVVVSENEPTTNITINNITFSVDDQKGMLVALYHGHDAIAYKGPDLKPHFWHAMLEERLLKAPEEGASTMFVCDVYNSGANVDEVWNYSIYKIVKAEYKEKPGQTDEKCVEVKCEVKYWDGQAKSLYYWYNVTYGTDGLAASSEDSDWKEHPSAPVNHKKPDSVYAPILQTSVSGFWGGQMNYNEIRAIVPAPTPTP